MDCSLFIDFCNRENIKYTLNEEMSKHTTFKIGGPADVFVMPENSAQLSLIISQLYKINIPYFVIGMGSNLLISDLGIDGVVISLKHFSNIEVDGDLIYAQAGAKLSSVCGVACTNALEGMEFAFGIPASVGGAIYMNAGAYDGEMSNIVLSAEYIDKMGEIHTIKANDMCFGYRKSIFKLGDKIITNVTFKLKKGDSLDIKLKMDDYINRRKTKQPLDLPSAGSTFKRPEGYFAGALIEKNNLKGFSIGGASVSINHAGYIVNNNGDSCQDVISLIKKVKDVVFENDGVELEPEIICIGRGE